MERASCRRTVFSPHKLRGREKGKRTNVWAPTARSSRRIRPYSGVNVARVGHEAGRQRNNLSENEVPSRNNEQYALNVLSRAYRIVTVSAELYSLMSPALPSESADRDRRTGKADDAPPTSATNRGSCRRRRGPINGIIGLAVFGLRDFVDPCTTGTESPPASSGITRR